MNIRCLVENSLKLNILVHDYVYGIRFSLDNSARRQSAPTSDQRIILRAATQHPDQKLKWAPHEFPHSLLGYPTEYRVVSVTSNSESTKSGENVANAFFLPCFPILAAHLPHGQVQFFPLILREIPHVPPARPALGMENSQPNETQQVFYVFYFNRPSRPIVQKNSEKCNTVMFLILFFLVHL